MARVESKTTLLPSGDQALLPPRTLAAVSLVSGVGFEPSVLITQMLDVLLALGASLPLRARSDKKAIACEAMVNLDAVDAEEPPPQPAQPKQRAAANNTTIARPAAVENGRMFLIQFAVTFVLPGQVN
jgi:hypothetical protein